MADIGGTLPRGFEAIRTERAAAFARPAAEGWVREALSAHGTLWDAAAADPDRTTLRGRGVVYTVPASGGGR